jgi:hypothetical protein
VPLFAAVAVTIAHANGLEVPPTVSAAWGTVGAALLLAVVTPGLMVARIVDTYRFATGCIVAAAGWGMQVVTGTIILTILTGSEMSGASALLLSILGAPTSIVTGLVALIAGATRDRSTSGRS